MSDDDGFLDAYMLGPDVEPAAPVIHPAAPAVQAAAPVVQPAAPAVQPAAPAVQPQHGHQQRRRLQPAAPAAQPDAAEVDADRPYGPGNSAMRTKAQHYALAARMREVRSEKRRVREREQFEGFKRTVRNRCTSSKSLRHRFSDKTRAQVKGRAGKGRKEPEKKSNRVRGARVLDSLLRAARTGREESLDVDMQAAFDNCVGVADTGKKLDIDPRQVRTAKAVAATGALEKQKSLLEHWLQQARTRKDLLAVHVILKADGAKLRMALPLEIGELQLSSTQAISAFEVLVVVRSVKLVFASSDVNLDIFVPIVPSVDTSACTLTNGLFKVDQVREIAHLCDQFASVGHEKAVATELWGFDGHPANTNSFRHRSGEVMHPMFFHHCLSHRTAMIEVILKKQCGDGFDSTLFSFITWLRMGSFFLRMLGGLTDVLKHAVHVRIGDVPADAKAYAREVMNFIMDNYKVFQSATATEENRSKRAQGRAIFRSKCEAFMKAWTCDWRVRHGPIIIFAKDKREKNALVAEMVRTYASVFLRGVAGAPEHGKWTTFAPAVDWVLGAEAPAGLLQRLLLHCGSKMNTTVALKTTKAAAEKNDDPAYTQTMAWHAVAGSRYAKGIAIVQEAYRIDTAIAAVVGEPIRALTLTWLKASSELEDPCRNRFLDYVNPQHSAVTEVLQWLAALGAGVSKRWRILYGQLGASEFRGLSVTHLAVLEKALCAAEAMGASTYRKVGCQLKSPLMKLGVLADGRVPEGEQRAVAAELLDLARRHPCCAGPVVVSLLSGAQSANDLLCLPHSRRIESWAASMSRVLSIADLERRNRRSKVILTDKKQTFAHYCASSILKDVETKSNVTRARDQGRAEQLALIPARAQDDVLEHH